MDLNGRALRRVEELLGRLPAYEHLVVDPADEFELPVRAPSDQVSGSIKPAPLALFNKPLSR